MNLQQRREYDAIHHWIIRTYGRACKCENPECSFVNPKRYEWALKKGCVYAKTIENFLQMCPSCHRRYDWTEEQSRKVSMALHKRVYTRKIRENMRKGQLGRVIPPEVRAKMSEGQRKRWASYPANRRMEICKRMSDAARS